MRIELHRARLLSPEAFDRQDLPMRIVYPDTPAHAQTISVPFMAEGTEVLMGRYTDALPAGVHCSWSGPPVSEADEDLELSREQLRLRRRNGRWELSVPGFDRTDKPEATIQFWGSGLSRTLGCAEQPLPLVPGSHVSAVVRTDRAFYWALLAVPVEDVHHTGARDRILPGRPTAPSGRTATADPHRFPPGWEEAVAIKYRPFLSWPMGWHPAMVKPARYPLPPPGYHREQTPESRAAAWAESVKRRLGDLKAVAVKHGMATTAPRTIDIALLEWLVARGELRMEQHRCDWMPAGPEDGW